MAESVSVVEEALAWFTLPDGFEFSFHISTDNVELASQVVAARTVATAPLTTLAALFKNKPTRSSIKNAVQNGLDGERDDQEVSGFFPNNIQPGSLSVLLDCSTGKRFLEVLADYESGRIKERLQEEFSEVEIKVEGLKVEIENMAEVNKTKEALNERYLVNKNLYEDVENKDGKNQLKMATMKPLPCDEKALSEEANSSLKKPRKKLLKCIHNSKKIGRSINHVSILLLGTSGTGKSTTVNHLLGVDLAKTSKTKSKTRSTKEFVAHGSDPKYEVKELSLALVDTPGTGDTDGSKQDACNLLSIQRFFHTHPTLSKCYPNLIFLVVNANDNRIKGKNSDLGKALRCIKQLGLVDPKNPNVVVILTHVCSVRKKNNEEWIKALEEIKSTVSKIVFDDLKVHAPVVLIENMYEDCGLERREDYTCLPNGEWQPRNLYLACAKILMKNNDGLGLITLNSIFVKANNNDRVRHGHEQKAKDANKSRLDSEEETMAEFLKLAAEGGFKDPFYTVILEYINEKKLEGKNAEEVMKIAGVLKYLGEGDPPNFGSHSLHSVEFFLGKEVSKIAREMLQKKFHIDMEPSCSALESGRLIGQGYNILTDKAVAAQVMDYKVSTKCNNIAKPTCAKFERVLQSTSFMEVFKDNTSYTKLRLKSLNVSLTVKPSTFKMGCRAGYNMQNDSSSSSSASEYSFLFEQRLFEIKLGNYKDCLKKGMTFTEDFKSEVAKLPNAYDKSNHSCVSKFERFFNRFGHFLVSSAYGGGSVEVKCSREAFGSTKTSLAEAKACLAATLEGSGLVQGNLFAGAGTFDSSKSKALLEQSTYSWNGGEVALQTKESIGDKEKFQKWKSSLIVKPVMLTSELTLEPISTAVDCVDSQKDQATYDALKDLLGSRIKIIVKKEKKSVVDYFWEMVEKVKRVFKREDTVIEPDV